MATTIKERPILFGEPMVRAINDDRKTQTRREVNRIAGFGKITEFGRSDTPGYDWNFRCPRMLWQDFRHDDLMARCPYGLVGDRLWVREAFLPCKHVGNEHPVAIADATYVCFRDGSQQFRSGAYYHQQPRHEPLAWPSGAKWRPSIHMPRYASRITLEITEVRVQRLQEITMEDAFAEGVEWDMGDRICPPYQGPVAEYAKLWEKINGQDSWKKNPWVWAITFKRV